ncbi:substrate-binding domain-containing protein [Saccharopolyspora griseoalba]|uniref:Substrate-binding domain-containing protein n=1 Tax=Saccharopolyspora griseoalba TaxID=1431848 RepID=A0ABW2LPI3_9PSEU
MREAVADRRRRILAAVQARGAVKVSDLAAELEVSIVTARRDVEELAREGSIRRGHGVARSLVPRRAPAASSSSPGAVALLVPERHAYLHEVVHGARTALEQARIRVVLHVVPHASGAERPIVERLDAEEVRGVLIAPRWRSAADEDEYRWLAQVRLPAVLMERRPPRDSPLHALDSVCSDHFHGMRLAVDHLIGLGHRRILLAARADSPTARAIRGAFAELVAARPELEECPVAVSAHDADPDGLAAGQDFDPGWPARALRENRATAAILHGDVDALMLVQQLAEAGVRVPEDCSVVAYDDVVAAMGATPLTAVAPPKAEVGRVAAELLRRRLDNPDERWAQRVELLPRLVVRGSTRVLID